MRFKFQIRINISVLLLSTRKQSLLLSLKCLSLDPVALTLVHLKLKVILFIAEIIIILFVLESNSDVARVHLRTLGKFGGCRWGNGSVELSKGTCTVASLPQNRGSNQDIA